MLSADHVIQLFVDTQAKTDDDDNDDDGGDDNNMINNEDAKIADNDCSPETESNSNTFTADACTLSPWMPAELASTCMCIAVYEGTTNTNSSGSSCSSSSSCSSCSSLVSLVSPPLVHFPKVQSPPYIYCAVRGCSPSQSSAKHRYHPYCIVNRNIASSNSKFHTKAKNKEMNNVSTISTKSRKRHAHTPHHNKHNKHRKNNTTTLHQVMSDSENTSNDDYTAPSYLVKRVLCFVC